MHRTERKWKLDAFARTEFRAGRKTIKAMVYTSAIGVIIWSLALGLLLKSC